MARSPAKLDEVDRAVVEAFLKEPYALPAVVIDRRVIDEETVSRTLRKASVRNTIERAISDRLKGIHLATSVEFLAKVVRGDEITAGIRERVSAAKAITVLANQMHGKDVVGEEEIGSMSSGKIHELLADLEQEAARRAKPVQKTPEPIGQRPSVLD